MKIDINVLDASEQMIFALRSLYINNGYSRYHMSKFEEYDFYSRNKSFLVSDEIITFTDTNGRLMALKPDVTLSIVKNTRDTEGVEKLYYNENVYRVTGSERIFREITQTGIECIGNLTSSDVSRVIEIASQSLSTLSDSYILEISDLDIVSAFIDAMRISEAAADEVLRLSSQKNLHELSQMLRGLNVSEGAINSYLELMRISDAPSEGLLRLKAILPEDFDLSKLEQLKAALENADSRHTRLDFSLHGDLNYYNGIVFKGYIEGIPESVLAGGQYDRLMARLGRHSRAIGFAVYLDRLERLNNLAKRGEEAC